MCDVIYCYDSEAVKTGQITSVRKAAQLYDVPRSTLQTRLNRTKQRSTANRTKRKLTETEEKTLLRWILVMNKRGVSLRPSTVQDMINLLLANRCYRSKERDARHSPLLLVLGVLLYSNRSRPARASLYRTALSSSADDPSGRGTYSPLTCTIDNYRT